MKRTITNKSTKGLSLKIYADATSAWHACFQEQSTHPSKKKKQTAAKQDANTISD